MEGGLNIRRIVHSKKYQLDIGLHVFPTEKYRLIYEKLLKEGYSPQDFVSPNVASDEDILLVHTKEYVDKLKSGMLSPLEILTMEVPYSKALVEASWICVGGTILSSQVALEDGVGLHIGGGFHHAFPDHGEGFCVLNDIAVAIRRLKKDGMITKALVIDCDLHHGNGTASIFAGDKDVFTFSIHQEHNYPAIKPPSNLDIGLEDGTGDDEYLGHLKRDIPKIIDEFRPEFIVYVAGADPYEHDQLGGLALTINGLKERDRLVFDLARENKIPIACVLAGGYAVDVKDTVEIHANTIKIGSGII